MKARKNIFLKTAFYGTTKDKYIAGQTSSIKPVEAAFCRDKQRRRNSVRVQFVIIPIRVSSRWSIDHCGHDPGNVALRPGDTPNVVDLA